MLVREPISGGFVIISGDALEQRAEVDLGVMKVLLKCVNRAGLITGTSSNINFAPTGFATKRQDQPTIFNGDPSFAFCRAVGVTDVIAIDVEANDLRAAKTTSVTDQQDGTVTLISQAERQRCDHVQNVFC